MSEKKQVLRAASIVGLLTLLSRVTGLVRESVLASLLGATRFADVFQSAFEVTNQARRVLGEGALSSFIVPFLGERKKHADESSAWEFFNRALNLLLIVALLISLFGMIFNREIFYIYGGFGLGPDEAEFFNLGARLTRIMFPIVMLLTAGALMMGACHWRNSFTAPSLGSVMLNISMIATSGVGLVLNVAKQPAAIWLAWAVLVGGILRVALMVPILRRNGWRWQPAFDHRDPELRKLLRNLGIGTASMMIAQFNVMVSANFAINMDVGVRTFISKANFLVQFPMALTATAVATAMLPQLTQFLLDEDNEKLRDMMGFTKRLELVFMMPSMLGLMLLGAPIIRLLMEHGEWTAEATSGTYWALLFYAPCLLPLGWVRLLQSLYYARKDVTTPLIASTLGVVVNIALNFVFVAYTDLMQGGLGLAMSIGALVNFLVLAWAVGPRLHVHGMFSGERIAETFFKTLAAGGISCGMGWGCLSSWETRHRWVAGRSDKPSCCSRSSPAWAWFTSCCSSCSEHPTPTKPPKWSCASSNAANANPCLIRIGIGILSFCQNRSSKQLDHQRHTDAQTRCIISTLWVSYVP